MDFIIRKHSVEIYKFGGKIEDKMRDDGILDSWRYLAMFFIQF